MEGLIKVKTKEGIVFQGGIWEIICVLCFQSHYVIDMEIIELSIDGHVIPKPESMEDDS